MKGEGRRLYHQYDKRHMQFEFYKVMATWRRAQYNIDEVSNVKFKSSLRTFGNQFNKAKQQISYYFIEQLELKQKSRKYIKVLDLPEDRMKHLGIEYELAAKHKLQFKQRYKTLKKAIKELEDNYGIKVVDIKLGKNNGIKGNDQCTVGLTP